MTQSFAGFRAEALEADAARYWHLFYLRNQDRFFKDRHYLDREFPLLRDAASIVEVGCGVGNTLFPLAELNPSARVHGCDFAASAIDVVRQHPGYGGRVTAHVADITRERLQPEVAPRSMAVATLFFVLSALSPETMPQVGGVEAQLMSDYRVNSSVCVWLPAARLRPLSIALCLGAGKLEAVAVPRREGLRPGLCARRSGAGTALQHASAPAAGPGGLLRALGRHAGVLLHRGKCLGTITGGFSIVGV